MIEWTSRKPSYTIDFNTHPNAPTSAAEEKSRVKQMANPLTFLKQGDDSSHDSRQALIGETPLPSKYRRDHKGGEEESFSFFVAVCFTVNYIMVRAVNNVMEHAMSIRACLIMPSIPPR